MPASIIAKKGALARWSTSTDGAVAKETHKGELTIGDIIIPCSVLEDGTRVLSRSSFLRAMGSSYGGRESGDGAAALPRFLARKSIIPYLSTELTDLLSSPLAYSKSMFRHP